MRSTANAAVPSALLSSALAALALCPATTRAQEVEPARKEPGMVFQLGVVRGSGGPLAVPGGGAQATISGLRLHGEIPGNAHNGVRLLLEAEAWGKGFLGMPQGAGAAQGGLFSFAVSIPFGPDPRAPRFETGWLFGYAEARLDDGSGACGFGTRRVTCFVANAFPLRLRLPAVPIVEPFVEWVPNVFTLVTLETRNDRKPIASPFRAGAQVTVADRAYVRAVATLTAFTGNAFGWTVDAGARF